MALDHGANAVTGMALTNCLLHRVRKRTEDVFIESMDENGAFQALAGKSLRKRTEVTLSGECEGSYALPVVGDGAATATDPKIDSTETEESNEDATKFSVTGHYFEDGHGDYAAAS